MRGRNRRSFARGTESSNPSPSSGESGTNRTPSLRGRRSIHQLDRYRRDIRRLGRQRRYGFDCDVRGMIMPGIESRNQGGREHATQPDPDQNLACRPFAAAQGLGGHAGAASGRRNHRPCGDRRQGHAGHRRDGQETDRGRHRLHRRRRILDGAQSRPLRRPLHRCRGAPGGAGRAADDPALDPRARRISGFLWRLRPGWVVVSGPRRDADATDD